MPIKERSERTVATGKLPAWLSWLSLLLSLYGVYVIVAVVRSDLSTISRLGLADPELTLTLIWLLGVLLLVNPFFGAGLRVKGAWLATLLVLWLYSVVCTVIELVHHSGNKLDIHAGPVLGPLGTLWEVGLAVALLTALLCRPRLSALMPWSWLKREPKLETKRVG